MESLNEKRIDLLEKFSTACALLPYTGFINDWKKFRLLSKASYKLLRQKQKAFKVLYNEAFGGLGEIKGILIEYNLEKFLSEQDKIELVIDFTESDDALKVIEKMLTKKFPAIYKLGFTFYNYDYGQNKSILPYNLVPFFQEGITNPIQVLFLEGRSGMLDFLGAGVDTLFKNVHKQIYLYRCKLTTQMIVSLFKNGYNGTEVSIIAGDVHYWDSDGCFSPIKEDGFEESQVYNMETLDLYNTCIDDGGTTTLNSVKLPQLLLPLSKTFLPTSLKYVVIEQSQYYYTEDLKGIFKAYDFNVEIIGLNRRKRPM